MLKNYFNILIRNMLRQKLYAAITVLGLTVGITFALLTGVFVWSELQVNQDLRDVDRLFLLETEQKDEGSMPAFFVPAMLGQRAVEKYPQTFQVCYRFRDRGITVSKDDKHFRIQSMIGDSTLIAMFGFRVLYGNEVSALDMPGAIVVTEKIARQFFNRPDVVGETLTVSTENNGLQQYEITAVLADLRSKNSVSDFMSMDAQVFLSHANRANFNLGGIDDWGARIITYLKLKPGTREVEAERLLNRLLADEAPEDVKKDIAISIQPLSNYYLVTNHGAVLKLIISLSVITLFILLLAIVNFVNITVARSFYRLREVGVRKVIGGTRKQVIFQFLGEAIVFALMSGTLSLVIYEWLHRYFGAVVDMQLPSLSQLSAPFWVAMMAAIVLTGILAGTYPALYLSATKTTELLKGKFKPVNGTVRFSRALIGFQFIIAVIIFSLSLIMSQQISFFMQADLGYDKSHVMIVSSVPRLWDAKGFSRIEAAKEEFLSLSKIQSASLSWGAPNFNFSPYSAKINKQGSPLDEGILAILSATDEDYVNVYDLELVAGTFLFNAGEPRRANVIVINESAQKALGLQLGDKLAMEFSDQAFTIAGIVRDFNFESFHKPIQPVVFLHTRDFQAYRYFSFELTPGPVDESVGEIEQRWRKLFPDDPFLYNFTDERLATVYKTELQLKKASAIATVLMLVIILTGVVGLVSLTVEKRTKEIGIRKVLGASVSNILALISSEYGLIMLVSFLAGIPLSFYAGWRWLENFAYRVELEWWMFALPVLFLSTVTFLMVVTQSLKTSLANPVNSLRHD